jgi:quinohemoprotein ethanol dehydrogenase
MAGPSSARQRAAPVVPAEEITNLKDIVFKGPFRDRGMPDFSGKLKEEDVVKIQAFIQGTAEAIRSKK